MGERYIIGNKIDLPDREVTKEQINSLTNSLGVKYFEISCKTNMNLPEVILNMIMDSSINSSYSGEGFPLQNSNKKKKKKCC